MDLRGLTHAAAACGSRRSTPKIRCRTWRIAQVYGNSNGVKYFQINLSSIICGCFTCIATCASAGSDVNPELSSA